MAVVYNQLVPVLFGNGALDLLGEKVKELGGTKAMLVYDGGVKAAGIAPRAEASLKKAGVDFVVFDKVQSDPADYLVNECGKMAVEAKVDCFIGVGGGSSLDCTKAASLLMNHPAPIEQYFTAQVAVITSSVDHSKPSVFMRSSLAIVDPELTYTVPPRVTANTGLDAFTHAAEAITAKGRNPRSELLAKTAIEKITKFLPQAYDDGKNVEARYEMALAANWAGIAFQDTDCHLGHCMADGISAKYHTPHGYNCIVVDPELMVECAKFVPDKVKIVGEAAGAKFEGGETPDEIGKKTADAIRALMRRVGIKTPKESGMAREDFIECAKMAMEIDYGLRLNCPFEPTLENVSEIYARSYDNY